MKPFAVIVAVVIAIAAVATTYRSYRQKTERDVSGRRAAVSERDEEARRRTAAEQEAQRLAALQAEQEAAAAARAIEELSAQRDAVAARRAAAAAEAKRLETELDRLRQESAQMLAQVREFSTTRPTDLTLVENAQAEALQKLKSLESEKIDLADRQAAHAAALQHQLEVEKAAEERVARYRASKSR